LLGEKRRSAVFGCSGEKFRTTALEVFIFGVAGLLLKLRDEMRGNILRKRIILEGNFKTFLLKV
jgi:hypothetical protein